MTREGSDSPCIPWVCSCRWWQNRSYTRHSARSDRHFRSGSFRPHQGRQSGFPGERLEAEAPDLRVSPVARSHASRVSGWFLTGPTPSQLLRDLGKLDLDVGSDQFAGGGDSLKEIRAVKLSQFGGKPIDELIA